MSVFQQLRRITRRVATDRDASPHAWLTFPKQDRPRENASDAEKNIEKRGSEHAAPAIHYLLHLGDALKLWTGTRFFPFKGQRLFH